MTMEIKNWTFFHVRKEDTRSSVSELNHSLVV